MATHFLHNPIATPFSIQRIQDVLLRLARDLLAAALPPVAWQTARELHYPLLALNLETKDQVQDAIQLLGSPKARRRKNMPVTASWLSLHSQSELDRFRAETQDEILTHGNAEYRDYVTTLQPSANGIFSCDKCGQPFKTGPA